MTKKTYNNWIYGGWNQHIGLDNKINTSVYTNQRNGTQWILRPVDVNNSEKWELSRYRFTEHYQIKWQIFRYIYIFSSLLINKLTGFILTHGKGNSMKQASKSRLEIIYVDCNHATMQSPTDQRVVEHTAILCNVGELV